MLVRLGSVALFALLAVTAAACAPGDEPSHDADDDAVTVDTKNAAARAQYDANVAFASSYTARCSRSSEDRRPRVLVTAYGRFMSITDNATGHIVSTLVPSAAYPMTAAPPAGQVDPPAPQLSVGTTTLDVPGIGPVDVCGMILPVFWDMSAILVAKELESFAPSLVVMDGVASPTQPLWLELGATNRAQDSVDGSNNLEPKSDAKQPKLVPEASAAEETRGNLLSWNAVLGAVRNAVQAHADDTDKGTKLGQLLLGAQTMPIRPDNAYLCNNLTYVTGYLMDHPGKTITLLSADPPLEGRVNELKISISKNLSNVPRVFLHWPSKMADRHHAAGAEVLKAVIAAQLSATAAGDLPTSGNAQGAQH